MIKKFALITVIILISVGVYFSGDLRSDKKADEAKQIIKSFSEICAENLDDLNRLEQSAIKAGWRNLQPEKLKNLEEFRKTEKLDYVKGWSISSIMSDQANVTVTSAQRDKKKIVECHLFSSLSPSALHEAAVKQLGEESFKNKAHIWEWYFKQAAIFLYKESENNRGHLLAVKITEK